MSLLLDNPVQPILEIPPDPLIWRRCESLPEIAARWQIYLHQLSLTALLRWFQEEFNVTPQPWPEVAPFDIWHVVSGLAFTLHHRRIVVILTETIDAAELQVPQEWVDISDWAAHYYIAAQVNIDEHQLALWGYTTHAQLKTEGIFDTDERIYTLSDTDLIQDFSVFWAIQMLGNTPQQTEDHLECAFSVDGATAPIAEPAPDLLIQRLVRSPDPRLEIPFSQWANLLCEESRRQQLYQQRQTTAPINLSHWVDQVFTQGWQTLASLRPPNPTLSFRSQALDSSAAAFPKAVSTAPMVRGKPICLRTASACADLTLVIGLSVESDNRRKICIQLYPLENALLPDGVTLMLQRPETRELLQCVQANEQDDYIQLPTFRCRAKQAFRVCVQLTDRTVYEDFMS